MRTLIQDHDFFVTVGLLGIDRLMVPERGLRLGQSKMHKTADNDDCKQIGDRFCEDPLTEMASGA